MFKLGVTQRYRRSHRALGGKHPIVAASKARGAFKPPREVQAQGQGQAIATPVPQILNESYSNNNEIANVVEAEEQAKLKATLEESPSLQNESNELIWDGVFIDI